MIKGNIYLVGFMGTGKTCVGQGLAKKQKRCFIDLDELIELRQKKTIADIFAEQGEPYFRRVETAVLKEVAKESNFVVSCGGGIVINPENIRLMKESGVVVCLAAKPEYMFNFKYITKVLLKEDAALQIADQEELIKSLKMLLKDPMKRASLGDNAKKVIAQNRGATKKNLDAISEILR